jgi:hypothetical protein
MVAIGKRVEQKGEKNMKMLAAIFVLQAFVPMYSPQGR